MLAVVNTAVTGDSQVDMAVDESGQNLGSLNNRVDGEMVVSWLESQVVDGGIANDALAFNGENEGYIAHGYGKHRWVGNEGDSFEIGSSWGSGHIDAWISDIETSEPIKAWRVLVTWA